MEEHGNICKWYLVLEGRCFLNGSGCYCPFRSEGCDIQSRDIFHEEPTDLTRRYEPNKTNETASKHEIQKALGIEKGDYIAEWITPYDELYAMNIDMYTALREAKEQVRRKFEEAEIKMDFVFAFHNVEIINGVYGIYAIGVNRQRIK